MSRKKYINVFHILLLKQVNITIKKRLKKIILYCQNIKKLYFCILMAQNKTLSEKFRTEDLQGSKFSSDIFFVVDGLRAVFFLCFSQINHYYLTLNHKQQCLFHLKTVV